MSKLTKTEKEVYNHLIDGLPYTKIAQYQGVTIHTIKKQVSSILAKSQHQSVLSLVVSHYKQKIQNLKERY